MNSSLKALKHVCVAKTQAILAGRVSSPRDSNGLISYITKARIIGKIQAPLGGLISNKELQPVPDESSFPTYLGQGLWVVHKRSLSHCSTRQ
jgi:hypothetical protein